MKPEMVTLKYGDATIKMPAASLAKLAIASVFAQVLPPAANVQPINVHSIPAFGEYWPGQGGINGGYVTASGDVPAHYLIFANEDIGTHEWGGRGKESSAVSKTDGDTNTAALVEEGGHPAAIAASTYCADGHKDFHLPASAELYQAWLNIPDKFAKDTWYWSSSQRSANLAFIMHFSVGNQDLSVKYIECSVRPVRRLFI
ncbi:MAG: DUF1566 domain-containing protein [Pseudomonas sp.]